MVEPEAQPESALEAQPVAESADAAMTAWQTRKQEIEERIGLLAIEQARLKAAAKYNREALAAETDLLDSHIRAGNHPLPLFDNTPASPADSPVVEECPRGGAHEPDEDGDCRKCLEPIGVPGGAKRFADLPGLTPKIVEILDGEGIRTIADWVAWPGKTGCEYTQIKNSAGKLTEARYEKVSEAVIKATT